MGLEQYFTPPRLAQFMVDFAYDGADIPRGDRLLEPSAGNGAIVRCIPKNVQLDAVELDPRMVGQLQTIRRPSGYNVIQADFMRWRAQRGIYSLAIMNPPYGDGQDGAQVAKAARLCPRVVALVRANFVLGKARFHDLYRWCRLTRIAILVVRPNFLTAEGELHGSGARHDFVVIEVMRREGDRLAGTGEMEIPTDETEISWRLENWNKAA